MKNWNRVSVELLPNTNKNIEMGNTKNKRIKLKKCYEEV